MKKIVSWIVLTLLLAGTIFFASDIKPVGAAAVTVYINSDGSITPSSAPISSLDNITYTFTGNISYPTYNGIVVGRSNIVINGNGYTVRGNQSANGFSLTGIGNVTIENTNIENCFYGIFLLSSSNNTISGNTATNSSYHGIYLYSSSNNTVSGNDATANSYEGIYLGFSSNNTVSGNTVRNNSDSGIFLYSSSNYNTVSGNNATANGYHGILLSSSSNNNTISGNNVAANRFEGIFLMSSSNYNTVSGNIFTNNSEGIYLDSSSNNTISRNTATANYAGILLWSSNNNIISENDATANSYEGIYLGFSSNNTVSGNTVRNNSDSGIFLYSSSNNTIYHNNFVNNTIQVGSNNSTNTWDNGYPSGGNYWSDYNGTDLYRGAYQNTTGSDGIGDTHYTIDTNNTDNYPLIGTFGSPTPQGENVTVFPTEDVDLTFENVTTAGSTTVNKTSTGPEPPSGFEIAGQYYDIQTTASYYGQIEVRIVYDDSGMTQVAEEALRLRQWNVTEWVDITTYVDTVNNVIYGTAPHLSMFGVTRIAPLPDGITILNTVCSQTVVGEGYSVTINVTVRNQGDYPKTFDVFAYANAIVIGKETVSDLAPSGQVTLTFTWSTNGFAKAVYTVSASDQLVSVIVVTIPGDVTGDFKVKLEDLTTLLDGFGSTRKPDGWYRHTTPCIYCPHSPNLDIDWDAKVALSDITAALDNFGKTYP